MIVNKFNIFVLLPNLFEANSAARTAERNLWLATQVKKLTQNRQNAVMVKPDTVPDFSIGRLR